MKSTKPIKLTPGLLKSIIEEEVKGFGAMKDVEDCASDAEETDADAYADSVDRPVDWAKANKIKESDTLDGHMDYVRALKIEEARLARRLAGTPDARRLRAVREALQKGAKRLVVSRVV